MNIIQRLVRWWKSPLCEKTGHHEWAYLKSPSGVPLFRDYCIYCKRSPREIERGEA